MKKNILDHKKYIYIYITKYIVIYKRVNKYKLKILFDTDLLILT